MTREPTEPLSSDEAPGAAGAPGPDDAPSPTAWEPDESNEPETWAVDDAIAGDESASKAAAARAKGPEDDEALEDDFRRIRSREPWRLSHLMLAIVVIAVLLWLWITLRVVGLILTPFAVIVLLITAGFVAARLRAARQESLLSVLSIAAERDMPLGPAVAALGDQFRGRAQDRILNVAARLDDGEPLADALEQPPRVVSRDALLMVRVGQETGQIPAALRLIAGARATRVNAWSAVATQLTYLLFVMLIGQSIAGFLIYFIVPKLEAIFSDFGVPLPVITRFMIGVSHTMIVYSPLTLAIWLIQVGMLLYIPFSYAGWMNYKVPIFDRLLSRRHSALVLRALSVVIDANKPIGLGFRILAEEYPARWMRRRLAKVSTTVQRGGDWIDGLWRAGVIRRSDAEVLASAASVGNLAWACRELADTAERRQQFRFQMLIESMFPVAVIVMGMVVAVVCVGYFIPLVTLIQRLSDV